MPASLSSLPIELCARVATYLDITSLLCFSQVSRRYRSASAYKRYQCITLPSDGFKLEECYAIIRDGSALRYVHHLQIVSANTFTRGDLLQIDRHRNEEIVRRDAVTWKHARSRNYDEIVTNDAKILEILKEAPALRDFSWACQACLALPLLDQLETMTCRIHMLHFHLTSLRAELGMPVELSAADLRLATSPCLHTIVRYSTDKGPTADYHPEAIMDMVSGGAPGLKEVALSWDRMWRVRRTTSPAPPAKWIWPQGHIPSSGSGSNLTKFVVMDWRKNLTVQRLSLLTDLSQLESLKLPSTTPREEWSWLIANIHFSKLTRFAIFIEQLQEPVLEFLMTLPALRDLDIAGWDEINLDKVILHCGHGLRRLICPNTFLKDEMLNLAVDTCKMIEDLHIGVYRHQGSSAEARPFQLLAQLPRLRQLRLSVRSAQFRNVERPGPYDILHLGGSTLPDVDDEQAAQIMRDLACDRFLAQSVWDTVTAARPQDAFSLECLVLAMDLFLNDYPRRGPVDIEDGPLGRILFEITPWWKCVRNPRADSWQKCTIAPLVLKEANEYEKNRRAEDVSRASKGEFAAVLHELWPESQHKPFAEVWHSFPILCSQADAVNPA